MVLSNVLSYYFKNILYMLLFAVVPAVFMGLLIHPFAIIEMLYNYPNMQDYSFGAFFTSIYSSGAIGVLWFVLGFLIIIVCVSFLIGKIELHFRTGNFDMTSHNARGLNNNIRDITLFAFVMLVIDFLLNMLAILLMFFVHFLANTDGASTVAGTIINWIIGVFFVLVEGGLTSLFMLAGIDKIIMGSPFSVAISNAFDCWSRHRFKNVFFAIFPFLVIIVLTVLGCLIGITWLTNIISLLFLIPYICILGMINFFEHYDMPRYDNRKYYNLK